MPIGRDDTDLPQDQDISRPSLPNGLHTHMHATATRGQPLPDLCHCPLVTPFFACHSSRPGIPNGWGQTNFQTGLLGPRGR